MNTVRTFRGQGKQREVAQSFHPCDKKDCRLRAEWKFAVRSRHLDFYAPNADAFMICASCDHFETHDNYVSNDIYED